MWAKLQHPNVLPLLGYAFDDETGFPLLVSEWMENGTAWNFVKSNPTCDLMRLVCEPSVVFILAFIMLLRSSG